MAWALIGSKAQRRSLVSTGLEGWSVMWKTHTLGVSCAWGVETDLSTVFLFSHRFLRIVQVSCRIPRSDHWIWGLLTGQLGISLVTLSCKLMPSRLMDNRTPRSSADLEGPSFELSHCKLISEPRRFFQCSPAPSEQLCPLGILNMSLV